ncbi:D(2) dopamine receptor-like isoform X1 [Clavelina lepadiformis]|uniref:D(2) dopamine receptor-like isoform X1 n=1 Tax=Clavelina lepadiformis TaxID=159417 RepID=UPI0040416278
MRLLIDKNSALAAKLSDNATAGSLELNHSSLPLNISQGQQDLPLNWGALGIIPIIILVAMGNVLVIMAVILDRKLRSATNCFLTSLAVADLLVALTVMPPSLAMIINNYVWPFSEGLCGIWSMLDVFFSTSSILHLCMISLDRYMALARPFDHRRQGQNGRKLNGYHFSKEDGSKALKRVGSRILLVWTVAFGIAVPLPIIGRRDRENLFVGDMCAINVPEFAIYGSLVAFFLPLVIMFIMYTLTIRTLQKQARLVSSMLVYNGKTSPSYAGRRSAGRRQNNYQTSISRSNDSKKSWKPAGHFISDDESVSMTDSLRPKLVSRQSSTESCKTCGCKFETEKEKTTCLSKLRITKALRRIQSVVGLGRVFGRCWIYSNSGKKQTCTCNNAAKSINGSPTERKGKIFAKKYSSSVRRISTSFKNRAMASITNEQRASKVLGLIFVLFCVFWCPFFITNVLSRLCTSCDQDLMGECMNWFVWVGYVSSGVNPCVYTLFSRRFRNTFFKLLQGRWSEVKQRPLRRTYSSRENPSVTSVRSLVSSGHRRSSKSSIRLQPVNFKETQTDFEDQGNMEEEEAWLNVVKAARNMREEKLQNLPRISSNDFVCGSSIRSSWHVTNLEIKTHRIQSACSMRKLSRQSNPISGVQKMVSKRSKRPHSESDLNSKQDCIELITLVPAISEAVELSSTHDKTWLAKEEDFSDLSASSSSSSLDRVWSDGQSSSESYQRANVANDNNAFSGDEISREDLDHEEAGHEEQENESPINNFKLKEVENIRLENNKNTPNEPNGHVEICLKERVAFIKKRGKVARKDSGMGASFDYLPRGAIAT